MMKSLFDRMEPMISKVGSWMWLAMFTRAWEPDLVERGKIASDFIGPQWSNLYKCYGILMYSIAAAVADVSLLPAENLPRHGPGHCWKALPLE